MKPYDVVAAWMSVIGGLENQGARLKRPALYRVYELMVAGVKPPRIEVTNTDVTFRWEGDTVFTMAGDGLIVAAVGVCIRGHAVTPVLACRPIPQEYLDALPKFVRTAP